MTITTRTLVGHITVDTGQFVIIDPAYLRHWQDTEFQDVRRYHHKDNPDCILQYGVDFGRYDVPIPNTQGLTMNHLIESGLYLPIRYDPPGGYGFDYNSAGHRTCNDQAGELAGLGFETAVASRTACGDGRFPVYHVKDAAGHLLRVEISFKE